MRSYLQGVGRVAAAAVSPARQGGVLNARERTALGAHAGLIELLEFMLVPDAAWRPSAAEVVLRSQQLSTLLERPALATGSV
jgi:hypothetical protein